MVTVFCVAKECKNRTPNYSILKTHRHVLQDNIVYLSEHNCGLTRFSKIPLHYTSE